MLKCFFDEGQMYRVNGLNDRKRARTSSRLATGPLLLAVGLAFCPDALSAQSVVSDGTTATSISIGAAGLVTVDIAPADSAAISHNSYSSFSVPSAGVDLNNTSAGASTIVNEVTSTNVTTIEGPLTVIGQRADVIIANPNGIAVNGGRFLNTGNVALTTGTLGRDGTDKIVSTVTAGAIDVGPGGLSGAMEELALISKSLRVNGPIQVDPALNGRSHANIITGDSTVNFDRARGGFGQDGAGLLPWALATDRGNTSTEAVIVDITQSGSLNAGRISMTVTDQGAGVRFAGDQLATTGGFRLTSTGQVSLENSALKAEGSVTMNVASVTLHSEDDDQAEIVSETSGVTIEARAGDIDLGQSRITGRIVSSDTLASSGGVTLTATGDIISRRNGTNGATLISDAGDLPNPQKSSNVVLTADGQIRLDGLTVSASDDLRVTAEGAVAFIERTGEMGGDLRAFSNAQVSFDATVLTAQSDINIDGAGLRFGSDDPEQTRSELIAVEGGMTLHARDGDVVNYGTLLQGRTTTSGDTESRGGLTLYAEGDFLNQSLSPDRLAVAFGEVDDLYIETGGDVLNETGRLFSNGAITVQAGGDILNTTRFTEDVAPLEVLQSRGKRYASSLFLKRERHTDVTADFGERAVEGEQSFILAVGDVTLSANNIRSIGADITGADVTLSANNEVANEARQIGKVEFHQRCKWFCRTSGSSSLQLVGGTITASKLLKINAGDKVTSLAGFISGAEGVNITAPVTEFIPAFSPRLIEHPAGLLGLFSGRRGYLAYDYLYGSLQSTGGDITINGNADLGQANLFATGDVIITGTRIESTPPTAPVALTRRPIGLVWNVVE